MKLKVKTFNKMCINRKRNDISWAGEQGGLGESSGPDNQGDRIRGKVIVGSILVIKN